MHAFTFQKTCGHGFIIYKLFKMRVLLINPSITWFLQQDQQA